MQLLEYRDNALVYLWFSRIAYMTLAKSIVLTKNDVKLVTPIGFSDI